ncbi:MAG: two-component system response regulator HydG [Paraglaciecola sp.]|jgi:two-component system response regulator HydG
MKHPGHILIIDDDTDVLFTAKTILKREYELITTESSPNRLERILTSEEVDLVILDMNFKAGVTSGNEGLYWLKKIKELAPDVQVIINTAYGDIKLAVASMKLGAVDFLVKPWEKEKLIATVHTVFELQKSQKEVKELKSKETTLHQDMDQHFKEMIFQSKAMKHVADLVQRVASTDASVLITGENGTGKEVIARMIHRLSTRADQSMIKVDLGALTTSLFESELFGHVKGAYTDAKEDRAGRFEVANKGTLFLDEIGNLDVGMQSKLLSVLQNKVIQRIGSNKTIPVDVRIISATNSDLMDSIERGFFRQDLLYRINTVEINLPSLRERVEDIALLATHYLHQYSNKYQKPGLKLHEKTMKQLQAYPWPGNVRELQHAIERAVIMGQNRILQPEDFLLPKKTMKATTQSLSVEDAEKQAIETALIASEHNLSKAAQSLGIGRTTLYRKMKKYGMD